MLIANLSPYAEYRVRDLQYYDACESSTCQYLKRCSASPLACLTQATLRSRHLHWHSVTGTAAGRDMSSTCTVLLDSERLSSLLSLVYSQSLRVTRATQ
eukprot:2163704-Rhodomonas_salina.1